jgi:hypothetical protein
MLQTAAIHIFSEGTSEGAEKGWDTRGRGRKKEEPKSNLHQMLDQVSEQFGEHSGIWGKLAKYGRESKPGEFTDEEKKELKGLVRSAGKCKLGYCYMNAQQIAVDAVNNPKVKYMEGLVTVHGVPIDHAWIEFNGKTFDPTIADENWKMKQGSVPRGEYFGIEVPKEEIAKNWLRAKTYSPLSHSVDNEALMKKIWKRGN